MRIAFLVLYSLLIISLWVLFIAKIIEAHDINKWLNEGEEKEENYSKKLR